MAIESRIDAEDDWFVGEDRVLRFNFVDGDTAGIDTWTLEFALYARRSTDASSPLLTVVANGHAAVAASDETPAVPAYALVSIAAAQSTALGPGHYQYVLRRTDTGHRSVLSFGPAELRSAVSS